MYKDHEIDGIIFADGKICNYFNHKNNVITKIKSIDIYLQNQFKNGGQSSNRLQRNRAINRDHYITELAEACVDIFYDKDSNKAKIRYLIFCGPAEFKIELSEHKLISNYFNRSYHVLNMEDMNNDLILNAINNFTDPKEIDLVDKIKSMIETADDKLVFGKDIMENLKSCQLEKIYIHKDLEDKIKEIQENTSHKLEIIKLSSNAIKAYGAIGVKFY